MKDILKGLLFVAIMFGLSIASYELGLEKGAEQTELTYINNEQVNVLFKSEIESCNTKWDSCGIAPVKVNGETLFTIQPKELVAKTLQQFQEGIESSDIFVDQKSYEEFVGWKDSCEAKWSVPCGLHYFELSGAGVYQVSPFDK